MSIKQITILVASVAMCAAAFAAGTVSGVKARQRYPWNGKVDIDCTLSGTAGTMYALTVNARDKVGCTNLAVKTVSVEGGSASGNPVSVAPGSYRLVWDADKDLPNGFRGEKISISVTVTDQSKKYMIVDLQSGAITYQENEPEGGWADDPYKLTKMVFRRIEAGSFDQVISGKHIRKVTITKPFYIGLHSVTKGHTDALGIPWSRFQWAYVDVKYQTDSLAMRLANTATSQGCYMYLMRGNLNWPTAGHEVADDSPIGVLRARSRLYEIDLPTEAQLALASRTIDLLSDANGSLDRHLGELPEAYVIDPHGPMSGTLLDGSHQAFAPVCRDGSHYTHVESTYRANVRLCLEDGLR